MNSSKIWHNDSNSFYLQDISQTTKELAPAIYTLEYDSNRNTLYLKYLEDEFKFDFKIYGLESSFISRCVKTYNNTKGNMGILLNGVKGTGKTVTAKMLCNELKMPVILINNQFGGMNTFLSNIPQDIVVFIDEYEKVYKKDDDFDFDDNNALEKADSSLLSLMDGVYKTENRRFFMLTTNKLWINGNLLNRPSRLRYLKNFADLNLVQINEIIDDFLIYKEHREDIISFLKPLEIITVDIVKTIVSEINIFNESPFVCCKDLNVQTKDDVYTVTKIENNQETILTDELPMRYAVHFMENANKNYRKNIYLDFSNVYFQNVGKPVNNNTFNVKDLNNNNEECVISITKTKSVHSAFVI